MSPSLRRPSITTLYLKLQALPTLPSPLPCFSFLNTYHLTYKNLFILYGLPHWSVSTKKTGMLVHVALPYPRMLKIHWDERLSKLYLTTTVPWLIRISNDNKNRKSYDDDIIVFCIQHVWSLFGSYSQLQSSFSFHFILQRKKPFLQIAECV